MRDQPDAGMKIATLDIETAPAIVYSFGMYNQNHSIDQVVQDPYMLCMATKWHGEPVQFHRGENMLQEVWNVLDAADVVVHYNGQSFDVPHIRRELWMAGFKPPSPFEQVDLYKVAKKQFRFLSNKLDYIVQQLEIGQKVKHEGFALWPKVMEGDPEAWERFQQYCETDTVITEELYNRMLPWIPSHPNVLLYDESPEIKGCPKCGSGHFQSRGTRQLATGIYNQYQCQSCFGWFRDVKRLNGSTVRG